ncbi:hypothetical protein [Streptacidiphilus albus]|uniref:hypothetical protein n=1 Tax=Streptacidiphilus albus TaxID=105425 RepID=UPI00054C33A3|nr:hypothetical protein [Streptacidiphilus albus]
MFGRKTTKITTLTRRVESLEMALIDARQDVGTAQINQRRALDSVQELYGEVAELESQLQAARNLNARLNARRPQTAFAGGVR